MIKTRPETDISREWQGGIFFACYLSNHAQFKLGDADKGPIDGHGRCETIKRGFDAKKVAFCAENFDVFTDGKIGAKVEGGHGFEHGRHLFLNGLGRRWGLSSICETPSTKKSKNFGFRSVFLLV